MARAAFFILILGGLVASGWTFAHNGYQLHRGGGVEIPSGKKLAAIELTAASASMLEAKVSVGTFESVTLPQFHDLAIVSATETSYCMQVGVGADATHLAGPGGTPQPGPC